MGLFWSNPTAIVEIKDNKEDDIVSFRLGFQGVSSPSVQMDFHNPVEAFGVDYEHLETFIVDLEKTETDATQGLACDLSNGYMGMGMTKDELVFSMAQYGGGGENDGALTTLLPLQVFGPLLVAELRKYIDAQKQK